MSQCRTLNVCPMFYWFQHDMDISLMEKYKLWLERVLFMWFNKKWITKKELCCTSHIGDPLESKCITSKCSELFSTNCPLTSDVHIISRFCLVFELLVLTGYATSSLSSCTIDFNMISIWWWQISVAFLYLATPKFKCITPNCSWLSSAGCPLTSEIKDISHFHVFFSCFSFNSTNNLISTLIDISSLLLLVGDEFEWARSKWLWVQEQVSNRKKTVRS
jgi:hypothetical protein